jgi:thiol-disulfide isomerase/thioredoxin
MTQRGQWILVIAIVALLGGGLLAGMALSPALRPVGVQSDAPGFRAVDVVTLDTVGLDRHEGEVVLLNIWATWCAPCEAEMPSIQRLYDELAPHGLKVMAVSVDQADTDQVKAWTDERALTFPIYHDQSRRIERSYMTTGVPETFVIDRHGVIVKKVIGATLWDDDVQTGLIRRLLGVGDDAVEETGG